VEALVPLRYPGILNVASGASPSVLDVAHAVAAALGKPGAVTLTDSPDVAREFDLVFDAARLRAVVPDFEFSPLADGLAGYRCTGEKRSPAA
jgi:hypothetical protein